MAAFFNMDTPQTQPSNPEPLVTVSDVGGYAVELVAGC